MRWFSERALCYLLLESFVSLGQLKHLIERVQSKWKWFSITTPPVSGTLLNCDFTLSFYLKRCMQVVFRD